MRVRLGRRLAAAWAFWVLGLVPSLHAEAPSTGPIVFGQSAPLSGPAAQLGVDFNYGANLYFYEINREGGVYGRKVELRVLDDRYEPDRTVENTRRFIEDDKVFALMGYVGNAASEAALPLITRNRVPFLAAFTGTEGLRSPLNANVFNTRAGLGGYSVAFSPTNHNGSIYVDLTMITANQRFVH